MTDAIILDISTLDEAKETMKAKFPLMVQYFFEDAAAYIATIYEGMSSANTEKIVSPSHTLKSSARQMGAMRLSEIAKNIELLAREQSTSGNKDMTHFIDMFTKLEAAFEETKNAFKQQAA